MKYCREQAASQLDALGTFLAPLGTRSESSRLASQLLRQDEKEEVLPLVSCSFGIREPERVANTLADAAVAVAPTLPKSSSSPEPNHHCLCVCVYLVQACDATRNHNNHAPADYGQPNTPVAQPVGWLAGWQQRSASPSTGHKHTVRYSKPAVVVVGAFHWLAGWLAGSLVVCVCVLSSFALLRDIFLLSPILPSPLS